MTDSFRDELGHALGAGYTIDRELTGGGMSRVFVATEHGLNRTVVVKVLKPDLAADVNRERFRREIMLVAQLQHPHIVPVLNAGEHHDLLWYTMPFVEGESLRELIRGGRKASAKEVTRVLHDVLDALDYAHARGVIHRDIKPGNILRHRTHSLVTDFGVAKAISAALPHSGSTTAGTAIGTPAYMAPEQLAADPKSDHRMDLYAVGLLAYELLTGTQPFAESSPQATLAAQLTRMPTPLSEVRPDLHPQLSSLITRLLAKNPDDRPASAAAAIDELEAFSTPPDAATASQVARPTTSSRIRSRAMLVMAGAVVAIVAAFALMTGGNRDPVSTLTARAPADTARTGTPPPPTQASSAPAPATRSPAQALAGGGGSGQRLSTGAAGGGTGGGTNRSTNIDSARATSKAVVAATPSASASASAAARIVRQAPVSSPARRFATPRRVAVLPPRISTPRPDIVATARTLMDSLRKAVTAAGYTLATDGELVQLLSQSSTMSQRMAADGASLGAVVNTELAVRGGELVTQGIVLDVWRGQQMVERETADHDKPQDALEIVRDIARALDRVSWRTRGDPRSVLVFDFDNQTGFDSLATLAQQVSEAVRTGLARESGVASTGDATARATRDVLERRTVGVRLGAGAIVAGMILRSQRDSLSLRATVRDMSDERNFETIELRVPRAAVMDAVAVLVTRIRAQLGQVNWGPRREG